MLSSAVVARYLGRAASASAAMRPAAAGHAANAANPPSRRMTFCAASCVSPCAASRARASSYLFAACGPRCTDLPQCSTTVEASRSSAASCAGEAVRRGHVEPLAGPCVSEAAATAGGARLVHGAAGAFVAKPHSLRAHVARACHVAAAPVLARSQQRTTAACRCVAPRRRTASRASTTTTRPPEPPALRATGAHQQRFAS